ncbi:MAG: glycosyltransferase family 39 protein, partial [Smithellaceae bacterium]|nr:glycosyltransferase family 39 protein [Smithellaceae bacterium]
GTMAMILLTARTLFPKNPPPAWEVLFLINVTLLFAAGGIIATPDTPLIFFWSWAIFLGSKIIKGGAPGWWYLLGLALGLGLLSKYTMIIFVLSMALFLAASPGQRFWFLRKEPYLALMIAIILFSPVIIWNWRHDWVSFGYQFRQGLSPGGVNPLWKLLEYLGGQAAVVTPLLFFSFLYYSLKAFRTITREDFTPYLYLILFSWPMLLVFGASSMLGKVAEANWPGPAYIAGFLLIWAFYHQYLRKIRAERYFISCALGLALLVSSLVHLHILSPFLPLAPKIDPIHQFYGWSGLGKEIDRGVAEKPHPAGLFLMADRGTTLAEALFYSRGKYLGFDPDIPERYLFLSDPDGLRGRDAVVLLHNASEPRLAHYGKYFQTLEKTGSYTPSFRGEKMDHLGVSVFLGRGWKTGVDR